MNDDLKQLVINEFNKMFNSDDKIRSLYRAVSKGTASEKQAYEFAKRCSELTNNVFKRFVSPRISDDKLYFDLANETIIPMLTRDYDVISRYCVDISKITLEKLELGLNPIQPKMDVERAKGLVKAVSNYETFNEKGLNEKIENYNYHIVDEHIKENASFMANSGFTTKITRMTQGETCDWCKNLAGTYYDPSSLDGKIFARHDSCDCQIKVEYSKHKKPSYYMRTSRNAFVRNG